MRRSLVVLEYLKFGFWVDLLSSFPYSQVLIWILHDESENQNSSLITLASVFKFMRFFKLLRIFKIKRIKARYEELWYNDKFSLVSLFLKIFLVILYFAHTIACLFWLVGSQDAGAEDSWIVFVGIEDEDMVTQYVNCLYWAFTTLVTIGYGDISAHNTQERIFVMIGMIIMGGAYAFTLSTISKRVQDYNRLYDTFRQNMLFLREWMSNNNLSEGLR